MNVQERLRYLIAHHQQDLTRDDAVGIGLVAKKSRGSLSQRDGNIGAWVRLSVERLADG